jgi:hypothetical protein
MISLPFWLLSLPLKESVKNQLETNDLIVALLVSSNREYKDLKPQKGQVHVRKSDLICEAIRCKKLLQFSYGKHTRVVEPHLFGRDSASHDVLSAYLVRGHSESRQKPYCRFYLLSKVTSLTMLDETFPGPRKGYNPKTRGCLRSFVVLSVNSIAS